VYYQKKCKQVFAVEAVFADVGVTLITVINSMHAMKNE